MYLWHCIRAKYQNAVKFPRMNLVRAPKVKLVSSVIHCYFSRYKFDKKKKNKPRDVEFNDTRQKTLCYI